VNENQGIEIMSINESAAKQMASPKANKSIKSDSVNLSSFLQGDAKKSPNSLRSLCGRYNFKGLEA
jgi:hypothetical protein